MKTNEGICTQEVPNCLLCGSEGKVFYKDLRDKLFSAPGTWALMRCSQCGLVWLNPRPVIEEVGKLYTTYYTHAIENARPRLAWLRKKLKHLMLCNAFGYDGLSTGWSAKWLGRIVVLLPLLKEMVRIRIMCLDGKQKGRLLDVGCGNGQFLAQMRDLGWEILGVEPDREAARIAKEQLGNHVITGTLEEASLPEKSFDAITLYHVMEHVHDPVALLRECNRVLKPGGKLVVVTPNIGSFGHKVFRRYWVALDTPRHLHLFSLQTLKICAQEGDLCIELLRSTTRSAFGLWAVNRIIQKCGKYGEKRVGWPLRIEGIGFQLMEEMASHLWKGAGEELLMIAIGKE